MNKSWTLSEGVAVCRQLQPFAWRHGICLALAGGVLDNGHSNHDLDIIGVGNVHFNSRSINNFLRDLEDETRLEYLGNRAYAHWGRVYKFKERAYSDRIIELYLTPMDSPDLNPFWWYVVGLIRRIRLKLHGRK